MEHVLKGDYSPKMYNLEGNKQIVDAVRDDNMASGIGYVGLGYLKDENGNLVKGIKAIKVALEKGAEYISPLNEAKLPEYAISRPLYQYTAGKPTRDSAAYNFLMFELSQTGQDIVKNTGFVYLIDADKQHNNELLAKI